MCSYTQMSGCLVESCIVQTCNEGMVTIPSQVSSRAQAVSHIINDAVLEHISSMQSMQMDIGIAWQQHMQSTPVTASKHHKSANALSDQVMYTRANILRAAL